MTIEEAYSLYGAKIYSTSANDSITDVVRRIYRSDNVVYYKIIQRLNQRVDWDAIEPNTQILYIQQELTEGIEYL